MWQAKEVGRKQVHVYGWGRTPQGFPGLSAEESACNAGDLGLTPGREDPLGNEIAIHSTIPPKDRGPWQATVHRVTKVGLNHHHH